MPIKLMISWCATTAFALHALARVTGQLSIVENNSSTLATKMFMMLTSMLGFTPYPLVNYIRWSEALCEP